MFYRPRLTLEEKLYERELQKALELSLSQSDGSQESTAVTKKTADQDVPVLIEVECLDEDVPVLTEVECLDEDVPVLMEDECVDVDVPTLTVEENDDSQPQSPILPIGRFSFSLSHICVEEWKIPLI